MSKKEFQEQFVAGIAVPSGSVLAFDLQSCPKGWSKYGPAVGRFIRGLDPAAGGRQIGSLEDDALQGHSFGDGGTKLLRYHPGRTVHGPTDGYSNMQATGVFGPNGSNPAFGNTNDAAIVTDGRNGSVRVADETRPKNVGLLFCKKD